MAGRDHNSSDGGGFRGKEGGEWLRHSAGLPSHHTKQEMHEFPTLPGERERERERIFPFLCVAQKHLVENELRLERNDAGIVYVICRGFFFFSSCKGSF